MPRVPEFEQGQITDEEKLQIAGIAKIDINHLDIVTGRTDAQEAYKDLGGIELAGLGSCRLWNIPNANRVYVQRLDM